MALGFCCNLHGACGGKAILPNEEAKKNGSCNLHGACGGKVARLPAPLAALGVAICTGRVEAKPRC